MKAHDPTATANLHQTPPASKVNRIAALTVIVLSPIALLSCPRSATSPAAGTGRRLRRSHLSTRNRLFCASTLNFFATADWKKPWPSARPLVFPAAALTSRLALLHTWNTIANCATKINTTIEATHPMDSLRTKYFTRRSTNMLIPPSSNMNFPAPLAVLAFLAAAAGVFPRPGRGRHRLVRPQAEVRPHLPARRLRRRSRLRRAAPRFLPGQPSSYPRPHPGKIFLRDRLPPRLLSPRRQNRTRRRRHPLRRHHPHPLRRNHHLAHPPQRRPANSQPAHRPSPRRLRPRIQARSRRRHSAPHSSQALRLLHHPTSLRRPAECEHQRPPPPDYHHPSLARPRSNRRRKQSPPPQNLLRPLARQCGAGTPVRCF